MELRVISIGAMASNPMWGERGAARTGHATTTLIVSGNARVLVDPGLPATALLARLAERANLSARDITHVFLTSFRPDTRRAIASFDTARWLVHKDEREAAGVPIATKLKELAVVDEEDDSDEGKLKRVLMEDVAVLRRCEAAPETIAERVDLFPLPGVTPGLCGLVIEDLRHTTVICGDAIPTVEFLEKGQVPPLAADVDRARESFNDAVEIADLLVLGRDNVVVNPTKRPF